jgi:hypothetical protein
MLIHIKGDEVFAEVGPNYILLICSKDELINASISEILTMVENAIEVKGGR